MPEWTWDIIGVLVPAVVTLLGAALYIGAAYLRRQAKAIENEDLREYTVDVIARARNELYTAVQATGQKYVADIKEAREDGKLTGKEREEARREAIQRFKGAMGDAALQELELLVGDLGEWIGNNLEVAVAEGKALSSRPSPAA